MSNKFKVEIITPDKSIFKSDVVEVVIPSYEGQMGILKVEFSNNELLILTSTIKDIKYLDKNLINNLMEQAEKKFKDENSTDKEKYILSYKIDTLKEISR